ncbi:collectin-12-like [Pecten maximus]|uniref:collectin-12-like n=1 Tax=Pecten maximus TaxID=6579 RepID=UPI0014587851|nr:collectin-12-like [Pecten maximus]
MDIIYAVTKDVLCGGSSFTYNNAIGSCIFFSENPLPWKDAQDDCDSRGGRLLVANTDAKFAGVQLDFFDKDYFWVGGIIQISDNKLVWLTGELVDLDNFQPGQPSGGNVCLAFWKYKGLLKLDDGFPSEDHPYLCELL